VVSSDQRDLEKETKTVNGFPFFEGRTVEQVKSTDTLDFNASGALTAVGPTKSSARYVSKDSTGQCYSRALESASRVLTSVKDGEDCSKHW